MIRVVTFTILALLGTVHAAESEWQIHPAPVRLEGARDRQRVVLVESTADGVTRERTAEAEWSIDDTEVAWLEDTIALPGDRAGETVLRARVGEVEVTVPVVVVSPEVRSPISFELDVVPTLTKAGCNSGGCHGASRGKDGFHLSLFGYDPAGDYDRITREFPGRRLNLALPARSLLLEKATAAVAHTGGQLFEPRSASHATIHEWVAAGAPADPDRLPSVERLELFPPEIVLADPEGRQQLVARAHYSDGTDRDVTSLAVFLSSDEATARVNESGRLTAERAGETFAMARFESFTVGVPVIVRTGAEPPAWPELREVNAIDRWVNEKLRRLEIVPSPPCTDDEFLRRVTIDIAGRLPTVAEWEAFHADEAVDKRARTIDRLLATKEFAELWVMKFAELLQIRSSDDVSPKAALLYFEWIEGRLGRGDPIDAIVRDLLTASGGTFDHPATNFYQVERDTLKVAENVAQSFLGMRIQCAQCHNHPFDRWTQNDYYAFAAFFGQVGRKGAQDPRETIVFDRRRGEVKHPVTEQDMAPKFLGGAQPPTRGRDRRELVAEWITSPDNPYFAPHLANIVWEHFFGRGIVDPVDDVRVSNPPSNPRLLDGLGREFRESGYDFRALVRRICNSATYQRSTRTNATHREDERNFSRARVRRLRAEVLLDAVTQVTQTQDKFPGLPLGARAVQIADGRTSTYFLETFGRASRETVCSCEVSMEPNLSQALHLLNGETVQGKITQGNLVGVRLDAGVSPEAILRELYVRCLGRAPTEDERARLGELRGESEPKAFLEDVFWALLNSKEFLFNH